MNILSSRRAFLAGMACLPALDCFSPRVADSAIADDAAAQNRSRGRDLAGKLGITTGSFTRNLASRADDEKFALIDLPKIMRDELNFDAIDLMTATLPWKNPDYCDRFRNEAEKAGRTITNLKMNFEVDPAHSDEHVRRAAIDEYKAAIDAAARLGCRWIRPSTGVARPDLARLAASYRELIEYAAPKGISLLVENNGWIKNDPDALPRILDAVGEGAATQPDTGNWSDAARYAGLEKAFPTAATCDFKALQLGPAGEHEAYDLRRCFDIGWKAGFRGPWCFEHFNPNRKQLFREFAMLGDMLRGWMAEA